MKYIIASILCLVVAVLVFGIVINKTGEREETSLPSDNMGVEQSGRVDMSAYNDVFRFSAEVPDGFQVEYVPEIESINIYDPSAFGTTPREKSRVFIRYFISDRFLTLSTVTIHERSATTVREHEAVRYVIEKKQDVPDFPHQPLFRNQKHDLVDVRLFPNQSGPIYVIARAPDFPEKDFENFLNSIVFHNDRDSFILPLDRASERITKKPFSIYITPEDSPVQPERFSGYHTGTDFETFDNEADADIAVKAICGGPILEKRLASGYGGMIVQRCDLDDQPVTVVYGHLRLPNVPHMVNAYLAPGDTLGLLGSGYSIETGGERKHLHLGIHRGTIINTSGYVNRESDLGEWIDYEELKI